MAYYKQPLSFKLSDYNLIWLFFIALIVYLEYMNFSKCIYFPTYDRDSLAGFDTIGYVIAQEHTLKGLSLFQADYMPQIHNAGSYIVYAPMVQLSYAFVYLLGTETSKLIPGIDIPVLSDSILWLHETRHKQDRFRHCRIFHDDYSRDACLFITVGHECHSWRQCIIGNYLYSYLV